MTAADTTPASAAARPPASSSHLDVLIVGAGLSGIGAAHHLQTAFPGRRYALLEARGASGGTWDLFRYPGIRSDSDMFTLGYRFRPWRGGTAIVDGPSILSYLRETAREAGIDRHIRYHHRVVRADWSSAEGRWTVTVHREDTGSTEELTCDFLFSCSGYYRYDEGYTPEFAGVEDFGGQVIHPQAWPEDLDYSGKRVVVIGSGATAVTLVPSLAADAAHVTMLQRSPSYIVSQPARDPLAEATRKVLPDGLAGRVTRGRYLLTHIGFYEFCRRRPRQARWLLRRWLERQLPEHIDVDTHFKPRYDPWDQRLCVVPGGDLFRSLREGKVDVVTDHIDRFTEQGLLLRSGRELEADIVVTATGLNLLAFGGTELAVDGAVVALPETMAYRGMMLSGVPNFAFVVGYTNASWTLKADLVCEYVVRLLEHMDRTGHRVCVPERDPGVEEQPFLDFAAGYVQRSVADFPKQGSVEPWRLRMNYFLDRRKLRGAAVDDGVLRFTNPAEEHRPAVLAG